MTREERLARTLVELADSLVDDFDVVELLSLLVERSVELLDASAAGLLLADAGGSLRLMASTSEAMELVEMFQVQNDQGPCLDCYRSGEPVIADDLSEAAERWPRFVPFATYAGFYAAHAFPLRLRGRVLGALNLFRSAPGRLTPADVAVGRALADVAAISLCQFWAMRDSQVVTDQLQKALHSRVTVEQAKGMLAERAGIGTDDAFSRLRNHARASRRLLVEVARDVVSGTLSADVVLSARAAEANKVPPG
ncbi:MAG: GAF and ANTAR domain-containing protein [Acidimicrobiales bacterium]